MTIVMWDPTKKDTTKVPYIDLLFVLYKGLTMDWFNPKHVAKAYEKEYKLCFNW